MMGTTGGDRELLYKTVEDSKGYAVISPQMGKQVSRIITLWSLMYFYMLSACIPYPNTLLVCLGRCIYCSY